MTFDQGVDSTLGGAMVALRNALNGLTNWSVVDQNLADTTNMTPGESYVLSMPTGDYVEVVWRDSSNQNYGLGFHFNHGPDYDTGASSWNDQYSEMDNNAVAPIKNQNPNANLSASDSVSYWMGYADAQGFTFYIERKQGDGGDGDMALGMAQVTTAWNITSANKRESQYVVLKCGSAWDEYNIEWSYSRKEFSKTPAGGNTNDSGYGIVNPDQNLSNFPLTDNVVTSNQYKNANGKNAIYGQHDLWLNDRSGADSGHRDTIQGGGGTNEYIILKAEDQSVALKLI